MFPERIETERLVLETFAVTHHVDNTNSRRAIERYVEEHGGQRDGLRRNGDGTTTRWPTNILPVRNPLTALLVDGSSSPGSVAENFTYF